jgi:glycosyltransferase involved in cell wall biosynthesis
MEQAARPTELAWRDRGRIAMVIRQLNGRVGGAERLFCETANLFAADGYDVTICYCDPSPEPIAYPLSPRVTRINLWGKAARNAAWYRVLDDLARGYPKTKMLAPVDWLAKNLYFTRRLYAAAKGARPDVIISFLPPANTPSLLAGLFARVPVVPTNHSVPREDYKSLVRWDQNPIDRALRFWSLHSAARIHVMFPGFAEWFPRGLRKKTAVIPNFISPEFLSAKTSGARKQVVLGVGRLSHIKNYGVLVDAWAQLAPRFPGWKLALYGGGPLRGAIAARVAELGLERSVELHGHEPDIKQRYLESEILCHPGLFEGFGLSVAEALACGLPVVAFADCAGVNEFVKDDDNGLLPDRAGGAAALAEALARLMGDDALRARLRARAPASVAGFNVDAFRARWHEILDGLIEEPTSEERR